MKEIREIFGVSLKRKKESDYIVLDFRNKTIKMTQYRILTVYFAVGYWRIKTGCLELK